MSDSENEKYPHGLNKNEKAKIAAIKHPNRRGFIRSVFVSGLVLTGASTSMASEERASLEDAVCANASFIDALVFQLARIMELQSSILFYFVGTLQNKLSICRENFLHLKALADALVALFNLANPRLSLHAGAFVPHEPDHSYHRIDGRVYIAIFDVAAKVNVVLYANGIRKNGGTVDTFDLLKDEILRTMESCEILETGKLSR